MPDRDAMIEAGAEAVYEAMPVVVKPKRACRTCDGLFEDPGPGKRVAPPAGRAAEMLPEVARFTLDEIEVAAADLLASSTAEKLAPPRKHSASASDPMPLCDCEFCARPLRDHEEEEAGRANRSPGPPALGDIDTGEGWYQT